jgi:hypothetical protein
VRDGASLYLCQNAIEVTCFATLFLLLEHCFSCWSIRLAAFSAANGVSPDLFLALSHKNS